MSSPERDEQVLERPAEYVLELQQQSVAVSHNRTDPCLPSTRAVRLASCVAQRHGQISQWSRRGIRRRLRSSHAASPDAGALHVAAGTLPLLR